MASFDLPTASVQTQRLRAALLKAGVSIGGIEQVIQAEPIASPQDRRAITSLIDALLGSGGDTALRLNNVAPEYKPRKPERGI